MSGQGARAKIDPKGLNDNIRARSPLQSKSNPAENNDNRNTLHPGYLAVGLLVLIGCCFCFTSAPLSWLKNAWMPLLPLNDVGGESTGVVAPKEYALSTTLRMNYRDFMHTLHPDEQEVLTRFTNTAADCDGKTFWNTWITWKGGCIPRLPNLASYNFGAKVIDVKTLYRMNPKMGEQEGLNRINSILMDPEPTGGPLALDGMSGEVKVRLPFKVKIFGFSIYHPPKYQLPRHFILSAPHEMEFYGVAADGKLFDFGTFAYKPIGQASQTFLPTAFSLDAFDTVKLVIRSNYGNQRYTSLYKLGVYGVEEEGSPWFLKEEASPTENTPKSRGSA